jgi:hypothetical protein
MYPAQIAQQKRTLANQLLLAQLIRTNQATVGPVVDAAITWLLGVLATYHADGRQNFDGELTSYLVESCGFSWQQQPGQTLPTLTAPNAQDWVPNNNFIDEEIAFIIASLPNRIHKIGLQMDQPLVPPVPAAAPIAANQTLLFRIQKLGYLNRKVCAIAENLDKGGNFSGVGGNQLIPDINTLNNTTLFQIFNTAQRARCSTFDTRATDLTQPVPAAAPANPGVLENYFSGLKGRYKKLASGPQKPFDVDLHRRRGSNLGVAHPDAQMMAIDGGGLTRVVLPDSTLGRIARELGLPERCDISGTTTDAVGAAAVWAFRAGLVDAVAPNLPGTPGDAFASYVLACIAAMEFNGHHSLSEMVSAASLWSSENYKPFASNSPIDVLNDMYQPDGITACLGNLADANNWVWIDNKWQTLRLHTETRIDIEFDDNLWNTMRFVAAP